MAGYWEEVERQRIAIENDPQNADNPPPLIAFRDWLRGNKGMSGNFVN